ncbi:hypothetical protein [Thiomicrorhabdus chilensis]|uniref:hypothetical protein n=1 Tax=Thiomicrorhabdus chilensis TaxID=63656 RepID=UPI00048BA6B8|nr:hypothetical protein [Thiomicrorhabdus chilensis]
MELKEFITESLVQIAEGIDEANSKLGSSEAFVNPNAVQAYSKEAKAYGRVSENYKEDLPLVELIEFDVAIQAESGEKTGGGLKISIASIGLDANGSTTDSHSSESRIKFNIPMVYPHGKII